MCFSLFLFSSDVNYALRKVVCILKPSKHIEHDVNTGKMKIKTVTTFKNFDMDFTLGQEFTEDLGPVDGRKCQVCGVLCYFLYSQPICNISVRNPGPF